MLRPRPLPAERTALRVAVSRMPAARASAAEKERADERFIRRSAC